MFPSVIEWSFSDDDWARKQSEYSRISLGIVTLTYFFLQSCLVIAEASGRATWLRHLSPHWPPGLVQLIWLARWVSPVPFTALPESLQKLHAQLKRTTSPKMKTDLNKLSRSLLCLLVPSAADIPLGGLLFYERNWRRSGSRGKGRRENVEECRERHIENKRVK